MAEAESAKAWTFEAKAIGLEDMANAFKHTAIAEMIVTGAVRHIARIKIRSILFARNLL